MKLSARAWIKFVAGLAVLALLASGCGDDEGTSAAGSTSLAGPVSAASAASDEPDGAAEDVRAERPTVVVTTNILGDVVENLVGDQLEVLTIMPVGADPHDFQPSAQQVAQIGEADVMIFNGAGFEEGLLDVIEAAEADGLPTFEAMSAVEPVEFGEASQDHSDDEHSDHSDDDHSDHSDDEHSDHSDDEHGDHGDDEHGDDEHGEHGDDEHGDDEHGDDEHGDDEHGDDEHGDHSDDEHDHEGVDPHFFTDPARMVAVAGAIVDFLVATVDGLDSAALEATANSYIGELEVLDTSVAEELASIPAARRVLVTNHEVFGYFAQRYDFEIIGTVIPGGNTADGVSAQGLAELAELIRSEGVPAIFADTSASDGLANTLADEVGDIAVVELFSESLGPDGSEGDTYIDMVEANAQRITSALAG